MSTRFVAGILFDQDLQKVALIRKTHPPWMAGKLNAIGGHIEIGETPFQTICREFSEETGATVWKWKHFATLFGANNGGWEVFWYWSQEETKLESPTEESVGWYDIATILRAEDTMANLAWFILMALNDIRKKDNCSLFHIEEVERYDGS